MTTPEESARLRSIYSVPMNDAQADRFIETLNRASRGEIPVVRVRGGMYPTWKMEHYFFCVFDDADDWDYIEWVVEAGHAWDFWNLPDRVQNLKPSDEVLESVFKWSEH